MDHKSGFYRIINTILIMEAVWLFMYFLFGSGTETAKEEKEVTVIEETIPPVKEEASINILHTKEEVKIDQNTSIIYIDDVAYIFHKDGYGAGHSIAICPMYDKEGNVVIRE